jgi:uncharacterized protein (TIGR03437 family)
VPRGLAVDSNGNVIVAGTTNSPDYTTTPAAYQPEYGANPQREQLALDIEAPPNMGYVSKLNASGTALLWSTFFGGSGYKGVGMFTQGDTIDSLAIDANGNILVSGQANSKDLPGLWNTPVASRPSKPGGGYVARLTSDGATLSPTQLLPGTGAVAIQPGGGTIIAGQQIFTATFDGVARVSAICDAADDARVVRVAPGQLLTLYGTALAPTFAEQPTSGFPLSLNGVTVTFNGIPAPLLYLSVGQINLQVPYEIDGQAEVTMEVSSANVVPAESEKFILEVVETQPSVFVWPGNFTPRGFDVASCPGQTISGLQPLAVNPDGTLNSCSNPAASGTSVTIFLNGFGATSPAPATGVLSSSAVPFSPAAVLLENSPLLANGLPTVSVASTATLPGSISGVAQVQVQVNSTVAVTVLLAVRQYPERASPLRGPGIVIWMAP